MNREKKRAAWKKMHWFCIRAVACTRYESVVRAARCSLEEARVTENYYGAKEAKSMRTTLLSYHTLKLRRGQNEFMQNNSFHSG